MEVSQIYKTLCRQKVPAVHGIDGFRELGAAPLVAGNRL
jgi:hypothetical protein